MSHRHHSALSIRQTSITNLTSSNEEKEEKEAANEIFLRFHRHLSIQIIYGGH